MDILEIRKWMAAAVVLLAAYSLALGFMRKDLFWSPDEGGRYFMLREWVRGETENPAPLYPGHSMDPDFLFYPRSPVGAIYPVADGSTGLRFNWPLWFIAGSSFLYRWLGVNGLYVLPAAGGILSALCAGIIAERTARGAGLPALLGTGLATPIFFYSVLFWEHTLATAFSLGAVGMGLMAWSCCGAKRIYSGVVALLLFGVAMAMRAEMLILGAAVLITALLCLAMCWKRDPVTPGFRVRRIALLLAMCCACLATIPVLDAAIKMVSRTGWSPFRGWQLSLILKDFFGMIMERRFGLEWGQSLAATWLNNPLRDGIPLSTGWSTVALAGFLLCVVARWVRSRSSEFLWMTGAAILSVAASVVLLTEERYRAVHGIFVPLPWLVALCLPISEEKSGRALFLDRLSWVYLFLFVMVAYLLGKPTGGLEWGLRYALVSYPLLAIAAAIRLRFFLYQSMPRMRRSVPSVVMILAMISFGIMIRGLHEVKITKEELCQVAGPICSRNIPVVTDLWWMPAAMGPLYFESEMYVVSDKNRFSLWLEAASGCTRFLFITSRKTPGQFLPDEQAGVVLVEDRLTTEYRIHEYKISARNGP